MDKRLDTWTREGVKGGLIRFHHEIAGVGLVFPRADRPIAVEGVGMGLIVLRPIDGIEFVEETVTALGYSTELANHLFRECWVVPPSTPPQISRVPSSEVRDTSW
jgi:hypothetical protein